MRCRVVRGVPDTPHVAQFIVRSSRNAFVFGDIRTPSVGCRHGRIKHAVRVVEPLRTSVVEIGQRPLPEFLLRRLGSCDRALRETRDRFLHPLGPFWWIQPAVTQRHEPSRGFGDGDGSRLLHVLHRWNVRRQSFWERERLEGRRRRVARSVFQARPDPHRNEIVSRNGAEWGSARILQAPASLRSNQTLGRPPGSAGVPPAWTIVGLRPTAGGTPALPGDAAHSLVRLVPCVGTRRSLASCQ